MPLPSAPLRAAATQPPAALVCARLRVAAGCGRSFLICLRAAPAIKAAALRSPLRSLRSRPSALRAPRPAPFAPLAYGSRGLAGVHYADAPQPPARRAPGNNDNAVQAKTQKKGRKGRLRADNKTRLPFGSASLRPCFIASLRLRGGFLFFCFFFWKMFFSHLKISSYEVLHRQRK